MGNVGNWKRLFFRKSRDFVFYFPPRDLGQIFNLGEELIYIFNRSFFDTAKNFQLIRCTGKMIMINFQSAYPDPMRHISIKNIFIFFLVKTSCHIQLRLDKYKMVVTRRILSFLFWA